jgi:hypothetical protein
MARNKAMAEDQFKDYFTEKLWEMIPAIYRHEDGLADNPEVLRSIVEVMADQAANVRRSHDRLWEDQFIELCNQWAVPYIGDLVGTRLVSALNTRARKVDVAKTIYYRRRKGTLAVLEELISDITSWEGLVVEGFRRLARTRHGLDSLPGYEVGRFTGTLPGGIADLRSVQAAEITQGAFDEFYHTPDLRKPRGRDGRYGIQRLMFYLYRIRAFQVDRITPCEIPGTGGMGFTFDPSGRDIPLYMPRNRPHNAQHSSSAADWGQWRSSFEWELPAPMRCRLLGHGEYQIEDQDIIELVEDSVLNQAQADELKQLADIRYKTEQRLQDALSELPSSAVYLDVNNYAAILSSSLIDKCGKQHLYPDAVSVEDAGSLLRNDQITAGNLSTVVTSVTDKRVQIDPDNGRLLFIGDTPTMPLVSYHYGYSGEIGAGTYDRNQIDTLDIDIKVSGGGQLDAVELNNDSVTQIDDSLTYRPISDKLAVRNMAVVAANQQRPYLFLETNWVLNTGEFEDSTLLLDGLWIGTESSNRIILRGDYQTVTMRNLTLDPGGLKGGHGSSMLPAINLIIEASVELLIIESCITGPIRIEGDGYVEKIIIKDSVIQSIVNAVPALSLSDAELHLERVTVIGNISAQNLWATDSLIVGTGDIFDTQSGCFRFSAAKKISRLPRQYRSVWIENMASLFTSKRFGDPGYLQLSENTPDSISRGAENGSEMGAYNQLINPIKFEGLRTKIEEYMPFGLLPVYIFES